MSQEPVSILFDSQPSVAKRDVWQIDLMQILDILAKILERSGKKDLRVAGVAAYSSSLIYRMKVERISALHKAATEKKQAPALIRTYPDIEMIGIPYRHESTYPVSFNEMLDLLQNLIGVMANPRSRNRRQSMLEHVEPPVFENYLLSLENEIGAYENLIMQKIEETGRGILQDIAENLDALDSIRCFFAALFLARDGKVDLEQVGDDICIIAIPQIADGSKRDDDGGGDNNNDDDGETDGP